MTPKIRPGRTRDDLGSVFIFSLWEPDRGMSDCHQGGTSFFSVGRVHLPRQHGLLGRHWHASWLHVCQWLLGSGSSDSRFFLCLTKPRSIEDFTGALPTAESAEFMRNIFLRAWAQVSRPQAFSEATHQFRLSCFKVYGYGILARKRFCFRKSIYEQHMDILTRDVAPWCPTPLPYFQCRSTCQGIRSWTWGSRAAPIAAPLSTSYSIAWEWPMSNRDQTGIPSWRLSGTISWAACTANLPRIHMLTPAWTMILCQSCTTEDFIGVTMGKKPLWWRRQGTAFTPMILDNITDMRSANISWWPRTMFGNWRKCTTARAIRSVELDGQTFETSTMERLAHQLRHAPPSHL